ncbi:kinase-like protein [Rhizoclosmatium globosum]|uniref:Kinase-like protein n=1 Tax=Rhizoclosmatium globosum TaxID=329046 RepID=A0A1Y2BU18_9FUNG|nr:kinase-like protein [Rhizoclosmatium globosum]|eukprot:ORY38246.1 kinase-like protein [Rhizoclosmatium globosum]
MISSYEVQFNTDDLIRIGRTSRVYRGYYHNNDVAVKVFDDMFNTDPFALEQAVAKEISIWKDLSGKPYILKLIGACTKVNHPFIVSELCKSTADVFVRRHPQSIFRILYEISCGLETIHGHGVVHHALRGSNVLITPENHAALADFGLGRNLLRANAEINAKPRKSTGTHHWFSPEQTLDPTSVTAKSDIWSFGMLMWELCTNQMPFEGKTREQIAAIIQTETERPEMPEEVNPILWDLMNKCWSLSPSARPNAFEIREILATNFRDEIGEAVNKIDWTIFISYAWANSKEAFLKGSTKSMAACGPCDPRELARKLTASGHRTWLDVDRIKAGKPLFENLVDAMKPAKLAVICVSNEYAESENCMREFKFLRELKIPYVLVAVGSNVGYANGQEWRQTVVGFLSGDKLYIDTKGSSKDKFSSEVYATILDAVEDELHTSASMAKHTTLKRSTTTVSDVERVETIQDTVESAQENAKHGDIKAQITIGRMLQQGDGIEKDLAKAMDWFKSAGLAGDVTSKIEVARMYENGEGSPVNLVEALHWYLEAANQNDSHAQYMVGEYYRRGLGMPNPTKPRHTNEILSSGQFRR